MVIPVFICLGTSLNQTLNWLPSHLQQVKSKLSLFSSVPSKVKNIHVSNSGDSTSLKVSWTPGQGDVDGYLVFLYRENRQLDLRSVLKHQNEVMFGSLQPGQMYKVTVQSVSGELVNNNTASGRTGQNLYSTLSCSIYSITILTPQNMQLHSTRNTNV